MIAAVGMKRKVKEGETEKEGLVELEEEFQTMYAEVLKDVAELVSLVLDLV
jgi:DNA-binding transcriptional ArsR family regulator